MHQHRSTKPLKNLDDLVGDKKFNIPISFANERDPQTGKPAVMVGANGIKTYIICGETIEISYNNFCILKDAGILGNNTYEVGGEIDPLRSTW